MSKKFSYEIKELRYGDYVCGNTVVEWKSAADFIASISDNRLRKESIEQANHYPYHFVIVAGDMRNALRFVKNRTGNDKYTIDTYYKCVASLSTYTNVIVTKSADEGLNIMLYLFKYCNDTHKIQVTPVSKLSDNSAFNYLRNIHKVGTTKSARICEKLNLKTHKDLMLVSHDDLKSVEGIGNKLADVIMDNLGYREKDD